MSAYDPTMKPRMRPVEAIPVESDGRTQFMLRDPTGLADTVITVSEAALFLLSKFDGNHSLGDVQDDFQRFFGQTVEGEVLADMVNGLTNARLLADEAFDRYYASLVEAYRSAPTRVMDSAAELGLDDNAGDVIQRLIDAAPLNGVAGQVAGIVAPHLDYPRGKPCYSAAYSVLARRPTPRRVVILGTNHFGQSASIVATGKAFQTPLGITATDLDYIERLEARCGNLREREMDHQREHSIELQVLICQHLWGADAFQIVPLLCPDPCGPTGTAPHDGRGVDLREFAAALRDLLADEDGDTVIIAGADFSHIGAHFGDDRALDEAFLAEIRQRDELALDRLGSNDAEGFLRQIARDDNPTRVCSAGCIFTTMAALPDATVHVLRYHQAIAAEAQVGVTCAAVVFMR